MSEHQNTGLTQATISGTIVAIWIESSEMLVEIGLDRLLTIQEICDLLRVKQTYIYWLIYQKKIPYIKMHGHLRFRQSDIDDWLISQAVRDANTEETFQNGDKVVC